MFYIHFLISSLISSIIIPVILIGRKLAGNRISARWQFRIWYLMLAAFALPLIPLSFWNSGALSWYNPTFNASVSTNSSSLSAVSNTSLLNDFALSVNHPNFNIINIVVGAIWIFGMLVMILAGILASTHLRRISEKAIPVRDSIVLSLFSQCERKLKLKSHPVLKESVYVESPITYGLFRAYTIIPTDCANKLSQNEMKHIFLHELSHIKHKDNQINILVCIAKVIYWFNPLVWIGTKEMKLDLEIACDMSVLNLLTDGDCPAYGYTILNFADRNFPDSSVTLESGIGGTKSKLKRELKK